MGKENFEDFLNTLNKNIKKGKKKEEQTKVISIKGPDLEREVRDFKPEEFTSSTPSQQEIIPPENIIKMPETKPISNKKIIGLKKPSPQMFPENKDTK